jgi:hypothetical protein
MIEKFFRKHKKRVVWFTIACSALGALCYLGSQGLQFAYWVYKVAKLLATASPD